MTRKQLRGAALLALLLAGTSQAADPRPNIVLVLADDFGYGSAGCYGANPALVKTPNIDRLALEGRRFTDANTTSSVCSPTRYSVLTGRYCWRTSLKHEVLSTFAPLHRRPITPESFRRGRWTSALSTTSPCRAITVTSRECSWRTASCMVCAAGRFLRA